MSAATTCARCGSLVIGPHDGDKWCPKCIADPFSSDPAERARADEQMQGRLAKHIDRAATEVRQHPAYPANRPEIVKVQPRGTFHPLPGEGPDLVYVRVADVAPELHAEVERLREIERAARVYFKEFDHLIGRGPRHDYPERRDLRDAIKVVPENDGKAA